MEPHVLKEMLQYFYGRDITTDREVLFDLRVAADIYDVNSLEKKMCKLCHQQSAYKPEGSHERISKEPKSLKPWVIL